MSPMPGTHTSRSASRLAWLVPPAMLCAVGLGAAIVLRAPRGLFGLVAGGMLAVVIGWILTSVLWPARADRTCPRCGKPGLRRMEQETTLGLRCELCDWEDESESGWLLAEEEGPLEDIVLRERR